MALGLLFHARTAETENTPCHAEMTDGMIVPASTERLQTARAPLISAAGCLPDTPVMCREHNSIRQNTQPELDSVCDREASRTVLQSECNSTNSSSRVITIVVIEGDVHVRGIVRDIGRAKMSLPLTLVLAIAIELLRNSNKKSR